MRKKPDRNAGWPLANIARTLVKTSSSHQASGIHPAESTSQVSESFTPVPFTLLQAVGLPSALVVSTFWVKVRAKRAMSPPLNSCGSR